MTSADIYAIMKVSIFRRGEFIRKMIKLLKNAARIGMGTRARSLLVCTGIPVLLYVMYIFACVMLGKYGIIETNTYELTVMLESEALALAISVGGVLLMDAEEKNGEKK